MTVVPDIVLDDARESRIGFDEAILCEQKTPAQICEIVRMSLDKEQRRLFTRLSGEKFGALPVEIREQLNHAADADIAVLGASHPAKDRKCIAIVSAGSSDAKVVAEARATLDYFGEGSYVVSDVGVAGIWRLMDRIQDISKYPVVIAVAGMDAALPTVLAGLIPSSIIGVPTSTGYGAARNGETALFAMLSSCGPGLTVTNIDNGYGAACAALRIAQSIRK